jgi:lipopolysaccharide transport system ATP-binding protein
MEKYQNGELVIRVNSLGKSYRIFNHPKDRLKQSLWRGKKQYYREFWALRGISFDVRRGETLGIIGRNGSGKSTLLQMICGTLTPSEGTVETKGRIAALLELGSGFNPEFTGIENVFLNGSLLGMSQAEIESRKDDILAFADIGDFVEQPVKTYSSGMALRLAFAVLAHSDPEILVVDEALSVGDAAFNQKCMRFIQEVKENKVLLYVSHDPASISSLCDHALWLHKGIERGRGDVRQVLDLYSKDCYGSNQETDLSSKPQSIISPKEAKPAAVVNFSNQIPGSNNPVDSLVGQIRAAQPSLPFPHCISQINYGANGFGDGAILIREVALVDTSNPDQPLKLLKGGEQLQLHVLAECISMVDAPSICGFIVRNKLGLTLFGENTFKPEQPARGPIPKPGQWLISQIRFTMPSMQSGTYMISIGWASGSQASHVQNCYINDLLELQSNAATYRPVHGLFACQTSELSLEIC